MLQILVLFVCLPGLFSEKCENHQRKFEVAHQWKFVNFTWESSEQIQKFNYKPEDNIPVGIRIHDKSNKIFLALPRIKPTARITLAFIPKNAPHDNPPLTPYPNWAMNSGSKCDSLQNVMSMDIGPDDIMWVLDATRNVKNITDCPPKIVLLDLKNNGRVVSSYNVPDKLCSNRNGCYLNDIVVDGDNAYCSDYTTSDPGIFVYNRRLNKSWKIKNDRTMKGDPKATNFTAQGIKFTSVTPINGIALSPNCKCVKRVFYYTPQISFHIYSIPTEIISNPNSTITTDVDKYIEDVVTKPGPTGGMICDSVGDLYFGLLPFDAVAVKYPNESGIRLVDLNSTTITWPDSFAFDNNGYLYMTATNIYKFSKKGIDINEYNFRILKLFTGTKSYHYCEK